MSTTAGTGTATGTTTSTTDSEEDEVRTLLLRHRTIIKRDLEDTNLLAILVKKNVLNLIEENLINNETNNDNKSFKLIDVIAKSGFQKFKEFCYAIENECEQLITDLITDRFKYDTETNNGNSVNINRDTLDSSRSRRSTSYCDSITPTPNSSSRRSSVAINNPLISSTPQPNQSPLQQQHQHNYKSQQRQRSPTPVTTASQQLNNNNNNFNNINNSVNINRPNSTIITPLNVPISTLIAATSQLSTTNTIPSPLIRKKNKTNVYRNGSLGRNGDLSETKKKSKKKDPLYNRGYYSMNETIEVLADPVFEEDPTQQQLSANLITHSQIAVPQVPQHLSTIQHQTYNYPDYNYFDQHHSDKYNNYSLQQQHQQFNYNNKIQLTNQLGQKNYGTQHQQQQQHQPQLINNTCNGIILQQIDGHNLNANQQLHELNQQQQPTSIIETAAQMNTNFLPKGRIYYDQQVQLQQEREREQTQQQIIRDYNQQMLLPPIPPPKPNHTNRYNYLKSQQQYQSNNNLAIYLQQQQQQLNQQKYAQQQSLRNYDDNLFFGNQQFNHRQQQLQKHQQQQQQLQTDLRLFFNEKRRRKKGDRTSWEYHTVTVTRVPGYGFGIAVSGGRDNPHFANGDPSIAVSDVLKGGPAEDRLQVNDRIISVNGVSLENVEYATAVQVLRDSGNTVTLVIKRRVPNYNIMTSPNHSHQHSHSLSSTGLGGAATPAQQTIKLILNKANKKDDFGVVLGCRLFVKEISSKAREQLTANGYTLQEGDIVTRIHNTNCNDSMSLKESKKIIDGCKERLNLVVLRDIAVQSNSGMQSPIYSHTAQVSNCSNVDESFLPGGQSYSAQNLYVQPPTRPSAVSTLLDDKSNLTPRGRSRGPLMDVSLSQLDRPSTPQGVLGAGAGSHARSRSTDEPPRPPPPRGEDFYSSRRQLYEDDPLQRSKQSAEPRFISFQKEGSVGIRLTGGNEAGIFVTAVQPGSPASLQGLTPGDKILKVNDMDMHGVTREEAVLFLLSLQDRIDLIVQHCKEEYDNVVANQRGDSFHIKTHFHCDNPSKGEMAFRAGDVFRVIDTLHNGVVGSWQVLRIGRGHQEMQRGVIPNKSRAEELATAQFNATKKEMNASESRSGFFRRRRSTHRRSKSLSRENWDDVVFSDSISKFPAYERVVLRHPGFVRPVVLFGPTADLARERLIKDFPDKFTAPLQDDDKSASKCGIVRLSNIRDIMDRGKHALLDITPNAVDRLNYAQFYPIVIFMKADSKHMIKQLRQGIPKSAHKSSKKLLEQCQKLERVWSHIFSSNFVLNDTETWYRKLRESVDQQQSGAVWMSETKPVESLSDDFLFPMQTSRLSYASSPESDLELSPGPSASLSLGNLPQLVKSSSDPSIATNQDNLDRDRELNLGDGMPPPYTNPYDHSAPSMGHHSRRPMMDSGKYGFSTNGGGPRGSSLPLGQPENGTNFASPISSSARPPPPMTHRDSSGQAIYGGLTAPDLPPRVDRASKPPGLSQLPNPQSRSGGTLGRSAQERLFGSKSQQLGIANGEDLHDDYATRTQLLMNSPDKRTGSGNSLDRLHSSLDRQRGSTSVGNGVIVPPGVGGVPGSNKVINNNGSYDSVSSYDSYNTTQMSVQNIRLGPNAPDDLKSVPNVNGGRQPNGTESAVIGDSMTPQRNSSHLHGDGLLMTGNPMHEHSRSLSTGGNANDLSRQSTPGRPAYHGDGSGPRNIAMNPHDGRPTGISLAQRPSNLAIDPISGGSPRKQPPFETKTDYGKYSRNNSATQADYKSSPKSSKIGPPLPQGNGAGNGGTPFKPVPPPKPKNYRPPIQGGGNSSGNGNGNGGQINSGQWENEPTSPRSPNGFYYPPPNTSHYHHSAQNTPTSPNGNHMGGNGNNGMSYGQYVAAADGSNGHYGGGQYGGGNGMYNGGGGGGGGGSHPYGGQYMHRPPITNIHHPSDRHALDLASSREQRGSAFELYRKPQIGAGVGHHHNMSDLEQQQQQQSHYHLLQQQQQRYKRDPDGHYGNRTVITDNNGIMMLTNDLNGAHLRQQQEYYASHMSPSTTPPPLPPPLKPKRKNSVLKSIKNAFIKTTKPLRRQNSMIETSTPMSPSGTRKLRPVRRQQSMLEATYSNRQNQNQQNMNQLMMMEMDVSDLQRNGAMAPVYIDQYGRIMMPVRHEPFYQNNGNRSMRGGSNSRDLESTYQNLEESESMYGNMRGTNENLYANRALIELERQAANSELEGRGTGRRIIRRHSMADRSVVGPMYRQISRDQNGQNANANMDESVYQSRGGSYMIDNNRAANDLMRDRHMIDSRSMGRRDNLKVRRADSFNSCNVGAVDPIYQSRREMHRDHLYQSRKEMQERIHQGRKESERIVGGSGIIEPLTRGRDGESPVSSGSRSSNDPVYQTRKELKENGFKTRTQLREHLYQTRRETMESMAEPIYVASRRHHEGTPIREHDAIRESKESGLDDPTPTSTSDNLASGSADVCGLSPCSTDKSPEKSLLIEVMAAMAIKESESDEIIRLEQEQINGQIVVTTTCIDETDDAKNREKKCQEHLNDLGQDLNFIDSNDDTLTSTTKDSIDISNTLICEDGRSPQQSMPSTPMSVRSARIPYHLSNIIKRTAPAPMPPTSPTIDFDADNFPTTLPTPMDIKEPLMPLAGQVYASRTSIETQYISQASLPVGPPNAQSTPYASEMSLPKLQIPPPPTSLLTSQLPTDTSHSLPTQQPPITRRGIFDESGGILADPIWDVSLVIPPGAIPAGVTQEIYFTISDPRISKSIGGPPLDMENGETMLSPLVMCGPQGLEFNIPVTLNIPHCAGNTTSLGLSLKATDSENNLKTNWDNIELPSNTAAHTVSVKVDHF